MPKVVQLLPLYKDTSYPSHCQWCGERFMGEDRAEVVLKGENESRVIHVTCFDPKRMEIA